MLIDTTDTKETTSCDTDIAVLTPASAPRIAHDVVLGAVLLTPADGDDSMVDLLGAAVSLSDDSTAIAVEDIIASSDSDVDRLLLETLKVLSGTISSAIPRDESDSLALIIIACSLGSLGRARHICVVILPHGHVSG